MDCVWSTFSDWSTCTVSCGGGTKVSHRSIAQAAVNGGKECVGTFIKTQDCNQDPCPGKFYALYIFNSAPSCKY